MRIFVDVRNGRLCTGSVDWLERAGHEVARTKPFDVALVGSPEAAQRLRREHPVEAIIVVTKIGDVTARVRALEVGADDAFDAGFAMSQIAARVGAAGRRAAIAPREAERIVADGCTI